MSEKGFREKYVDRPVNEHEILRCLVGSRCYGTAIENPPSDFDYKGVYIAPENQIIGIFREQETKRYGPDDQDFSLRHFAKLCAKCVPNVLELLFCEEDCVVEATKEGQLLRAQRDLFLSKNCIRRLELA